MKMKFFVCVVTLMFSGLVLFPGQLLEAAPLNILLTNDDGYDAPGIQYLYAALMAAGHHVTLVAPLENQSGKGGSFSSGDWIEVIEQSPGIWSVDGTPSDSVVTGLDVILANNPPDLLISGINFGQNLGKIASFGSGTVCAALTARLLRNIPAIAVSLGIILEEMSETPIPFPSTFASFPLAADYTVRLVDRLDNTRKEEDNERMLQPGIILNIVIPVPYVDIKGQQFTRLGEKSFGSPVFMDVNGVIPNGGGLIYMWGVLHQPPDPVPNADTTAYWDNYITITFMDGDMSVADSLTKRINKLKRRLDNIQIH